MKSFVSTDKRLLKNYRSLASIIISVIMSVVVISAGPSYSQEEWIELFSDDFESSPIRTWELEAGWRIEEEENNSILVGTGHHWASLKQNYNWRDFRFDIRVKIIREAVHLNIRINDDGRYYVSVGEDGITLNKQFWPDHFLPELARNSRPISLGEWHIIRIEVGGPRIQVSVDGSKRIDYIDNDDPILSGSIALETIWDQDCLVYFDDVSVMKKIQPTPTPTQTPQLKPTHTPIPSIITPTPVQTKTPPPTPLFDPFEWTQTMGPGGGVIRGAIAVAPSSPNILYAGTDISGVYKSTDFGKTWYETDLPHAPIEGRSIAIHPTNHNIVYVGTGNSLYKTSNDGKTWEKIYTHKNGNSFTCIAIDPVDPQMIYAGTWKGDFLKSTNGGQNWSLKTNGLDTTHIISRILVDPKNPSILYAATGYWDTDGTTGSNGLGYPGPGEGIFKSTDGGNQWTAINNGLPSWTHFDWGTSHITINDLEMDPNDSNVLYVSWHPSPESHSFDTIYKSTDGGLTWKPFVDTFFGHTECLAIHPTDSNVLYASAGKNRVMKTMDGGKTWQKCSGTALITSQFFIDILIDPVNPNNVYGASYYKGIVRSTDGGQTWIRSNDGINITTNYFVEVDPNDSKTVYSGVSESVLFKTTDGGDSWFVPDFEFGDLGYVYGIVVDPFDSNTVYVGTGHQAVQHNDGIFKTTDGCNTWQKKNEGINTPGIISIEDSALKVDGKTGEGAKVFYSNEATSKERDDEYLVLNDSAWIQVQSNRSYTFKYKYKGSFDAIYIYGLDNNNEINTILEHNRWGQYAETFQSQTFSFFVPQGVTKIAVELNPLNNIAWFKDLSLLENSGSQNIFKNGDFSQGLLHWHYFSNYSARNIYFIALDPNNNNILYACSEKGYVYKSLNRAESWELINGFTTFNTVNVIATHPTDPESLMVGTNSKYRDGGGLFSSKNAGGRWLETKKYSGEGEGGTKRVAPRYAYAIVYDHQNPDRAYTGDAREPILFKCENQGLDWETVVDLRNDDIYEGLRGLAVDPNDSKNVYAGFTGERAKLLSSNDYGATWSTLGDHFTLCTVHEMAIDPSNEKIVYAAPWGGGLYRSNSAGWTWQKLNLPTKSVAAMLVDPNNTDRLLAGDRNAPTIYESLDSGKTWSPLITLNENDYYRMSSMIFHKGKLYFSAFKRDQNQFAVYTSAPMSGEVFMWDGFNLQAIGGNTVKRTVLSFFSDGISLYAVVHINGVYSWDGASWRDLTSNLPDMGFNNITSTSAGDLFLAGGCDFGIKGKARIGDSSIVNQIYKSGNQGGTWRSLLNNDPFDSAIKKVVIHPQNDQVLYAATQNGLYLSTDSGVNWSKQNTGLNFLNIGSLVVGNNTIYAGTLGGGVYKGTIKADYSISWDDSNGPYPEIDNIQIAVSPNRSDTLYVTSFPGGVFKSTNRGHTWLECNFALPSADVYDPFTQGYYSLEIDPNQPETLYLGIFGKGVFKSTDGGQVWMPFNHHFGSAFYRRIQEITSLVIDPTDSTKLYVAMKTGVLHSSDGGMNWQDISNNLAIQDIVTLEISVDGTTLFAGTRGGGVYKTSTATIDWKATHFLKTDPRICWIAIDPNDSNTIYLAINPSGMYKSTDGGNNWREINVGLTNTIAYPIAINPHNSQEIYVGTGYKRDANSESGGGDGVYKSLDGGEHWYPANGDLPEDIIVNEIKFDPWDHDIIYIGTEGWNSGNLGIFMSNDKGKSWHPINNNGIEEYSVYSFSFDTSGKYLYVGTNFAGVWRGERNPNFPTPSPTPQPSNVSDWMIR